MSEARKIIGQVLAIGALGLLVAAAVQFPLVKRFIRGEFRETFLPQAEYRGVLLITLEEAEDLWSGGGAVFFDARPAALYGQGHAPGARHIDASETGPRIAAAVQDILRERTLVVYCEGGDCLSSLHLAKRLHDEGFKDIRVMTGGWEEWKRAGLPEERGDDKK